MGIAYDYPKRVRPNEQMLIVGSAVDADEAVAGEPVYFSVKPVGSGKHDWVTLGQSTKLLEDGLKPFFIGRGRFSFQVKAPSQLGFYDTRTYTLGYGSGGRVREHRALESEGGELYVGFDVPSKGLEGIANLHPVIKIISLIGIGGFLALWGSGNGGNPSSDNPGEREESSVCPECGQEL